LNFSNNAYGIWPSVSVVGVGFTLSGGAEWLAWESRRDDIHASTPRSPVECSNVIPDWGVVKVSVPDSCFDDFDWVFLSLDIADRRPSE
jgi:hypothetical protein